MKSFLAATLLLALPAAAASPDFSKGGAIVALQYGYGLWSVDRAQLASQVGQADADLVFAETKNGHSATLRLGYNILGHATPEATLTATGWDITESNRGGGGFATGGVHWHPIEIFMKGRERFYDASLFVGFGYGIVGQTRGMDGFVWQYGVNTDFYLAQSIALGLFFRSTQTNFSSFYLDYNNRSQPGATIPLPNGSGGAFRQVGVTVTLRVAP